ncbi:uncharacterized protein LOC111704804 [Eurytemora carolleeae]|uniref:uncharacterized protein LOC111704804 n=1 Tax=Eurytemora carolleeae TaxID=1294199 RepID=UPI000C790763|nr:uncharacterized protein LOC111704804 [Eurytemora carolleeae]|eukprot:XP_023332921.1 uncharacterized protein LOC111704804 [Eurytemora affinis]
MLRLTLLLMWVGVEVNGHGRLIEPPSRSTMWRYGFDSPANYNDHELYCGGYTRQWQTNGGKCGICGDPWDSPQPRANEAGGKYGNGIITRSYRKNSNIKVKIELTANHMGHFEFRLCPTNSKVNDASQSCLDQYILRRVSGGPDYYPGPGNRIFEIIYQLPKDLTCTQCVFQWRYIAGNNWGLCRNGTGAVGCGPQEEFRACADISITEQDGTADSTPLEQDTDQVQLDWNKEQEQEQEKEQEKEQEEEQEEEEVNNQNLIIIILSTLLSACIMFCAVFFYYYKAKSYLTEFIEDKGLEIPGLPKLKKMPSMPSMSSMPGMPSMPRIPNKPKFLRWPKISEINGQKLRGLCKLDTFDKLNWPLSNISLGDKLPSFKQSASTVGSIPAAAATAPVPPPRTKRPKSRPPSPGSVQPRLATILPRPHPRPPAPPPSRPSVPAVLEISSPTGVTINGVTVQKPSPMSNTAAGPSEVKKC